MASKFSEVPMGRVASEGFALLKTFAEDTFESKVSVGAGIYRNEKGQPWVLPAVREAEKDLAADETLNKEYLPILGLEAFNKIAVTMLLGKDNIALKENRAFAVQCLSGCGGLRLGAEFLVKMLGYKTLYYSNPTYENHRWLMECGGFETFHEYHYWNASTRKLDIENFLGDLKTAPKNSVILLHACAHNPTGCDPTEEQWKQIADVIQERELFPFFDSAYQGFATGDLERDAWAVRYFASRGIEFLCAQSFSKNFGLYNERVGGLVFVLNNASYVPQVKSQITLIVRGMYSNPPSHGARIVAHIFNNPKLYDKWMQNLQTMSSRLADMRKALRAALEQLGTPGDWSHITSQIGMFSYTGLNAQQSEHMVKKHHVYMLRSGRISMTGLTLLNIDYVARAIHETLTNVK